MNEASSPQIILGIDPGTVVTGYGVISVDRTYLPLDYGCIRPPPRLKLSDRYLIIYKSIKELLEKYKPSTLVLETQFVKNNGQSNNAQTVFKFCMVRGVVMIAAKEQGLRVYQYSPAVAKRAVAGNGRASKFQVQGMVQRLLNLSLPPEPEDASDALALAICHAQSALHLREQNET